MSIEKLTSKLNDESNVIKETVPFSQISNEVIEHIKDNDSYRLWSFLQAKPGKWKVIKEYAREKCGVGERKATFCWAYLVRCGLAETLAIKDEKGKIIRHDFVILSGKKFNKNEPFIKEKSTGAKTASVGRKSVDKSTGAKIHVVEKRGLLNKDNKQNNKKKSFYENKKKKRRSDWRNENAKTHDFAESMDNAARSKPQMAREAKYIEESNKHKWAAMPDELRSKIRTIKMQCRINA